MRFKLVKVLKGVEMSNALYVEQRSLRRGSSLSWDLVHHMYTRQAAGYIVIISDDPVITLSAAKKQWIALSRHVHRERAATLKATRIQELTREMSHMQRLLFTTKPPAEDNPKEGAYFVTPAALADQPLACTTLYVTKTLDDAILKKCTSAMPSHAVVVLYE
jgi:hypothetical protein